MQRRRGTKMVVAFFSRKGGEEGEVIFALSLHESIKFIP